MKSVHVATGLVFALIACATCASPLPPSSSAVGDWEGREGRFVYLHIRFTQQGNDLQGTACYTSDLDVIFKGVPVQINYPHVSVSAPNGFTFVGDFVAKGTISGNRSMGGSPPSSMTLNLSSGSYALCLTP